MYLETYSMEELMELIEEKGYCSVEAVEILKEMEQAKKEDRKSTRLNSSHT